MAKLTTRQKVLVYERLRVGAFIVGLAAVLELSDPRPFLQTLQGRIGFFLLVAEVARQAYYLRQEGDEAFYARTRGWHERWRGFVERVPSQVRWRLGRAGKAVLGVVVLGALADAATTSCTGAINCLIWAPRELWAGLPGYLELPAYLLLGLLQVLVVAWWLGTRGTYEVIDPYTIETRFSDVWGQDKAVERMREHLFFLEEPEEIERHGGFMPKGVLLWGPPGTGKTMLAKAMAGETSKPLVLVPPGGFEGWLGIAKLKRLFASIRKLALRYDGCVVFFDEIDTLGNRGVAVTGATAAAGAPVPARAAGCVVDGYGLHPSAPPHGWDDRGGGGRDPRTMGVLETFLAELDGMDKPKGSFNRIRRFFGFSASPPPRFRYLLVAATNIPHRLDPALLRPGRLDRKVRVWYPDEAGRYATFQGYLRRVRHRLSDAQVRLLARNDPRATGAGIRDAVNEALIEALRAGRSEVTWEDMSTALIWKAVGEEEGVQPDREDQWRVSVHEAAHAVAAHYLREGHRIQFASVARRGESLGVVSSVPLEERYTRTRSQLIGDIKVSLASHVAERHFFADDVSTGPFGDLLEATRTARALVTRYGMARRLAVADDEVGAGEQAEREEVEALLREIYEELEPFLVERSDQVLAVAGLLHDRSTVDGSEIHRLLERMERAA